MHPARYVAERSRLRIHAVRSQRVNNYTPIAPRRAAPHCIAPAPHATFPSLSLSQNNIERLYCTGILVIGACFYAIVVGHMARLDNTITPTPRRHTYNTDIINTPVR